MKRFVRPDGVRSSGYFMAMRTGLAERRIHVACAPGAADSAMESSRSGLSATAFALQGCTRGKGGTSTEFVIRLANRVAPFSQWMTRYVMAKIMRNSER